MGFLLASMRGLPSDSQASFDHDFYASDMHARSVHNDNWFFRRELNMDSRLRSFFAVFILGGVAFIILSGRAIMGQFRVGAS